MPLDINQYPQGCLGVSHILAGYSGYMVYRLYESIGIWLPQGSTSSIHGLQTRAYEIVGYHGIWVLRSNLIY